MQFKENLEEYWENDEEIVLELEILHQDSWTQLNSNVYLSSVFSQWFVAQFCFSLKSLKISSFSNHVSIHSKRNFDCSMFCTNLTTIIDDLPQDYICNEDMNVLFS